jgi:ADP-ribose pyrophosphatase YjhB (NUDIX family)
MPLLPGKKNVGHNISEMEASGHPRDQSIAAALNEARKHKEGGGGLGMLHIPHIHPKKIRPPRAFRQTQHRIHTGPIHSSVAGRTDHLPMHVPSGSYVLPADIISGMGEGNTIAGFKHARRMFGGTAYGGGAQPYNHEGGPYGMATGGAIKHHAAGILFMSPDDKILLMRRTGKDHAGEWALPGGGIEKGESVEDAARRELHEETGHKFDGHLTPVTRRKKDGVDFTTLLAHAEPFQPKINDEHDAYAWVPRADALKARLHPGVKDTLEQLAAPIGKAGGGASSGVPIVAAGGEYVLHPDEVREVGGGDLDTGHQVLDGFVKRMREELIGTLKNLPGPRKD